MLPLRWNTSHVPLPFIRDTQELSYQVKYVKAVNPIYNYLIAFGATMKLQDYDVEDKEEIFNDLFLLLHEKMKDYTDNYFIWKELGIEGDYHFHGYVYSHNQNLQEKLDKLVKPELSAYVKFMKSTLVNKQSTNINTQMNYFRKPFTREYGELKKMSKEQKIDITERCWLMVKQLNNYKNAFFVVNGKERDFYYAQSFITDETIEQLNNEKQFDFTPKSKITITLKGQEHYRNRDKHREFFKIMRFNCKSVFIYKETLFEKYEVEIYLKSSNQKHLALAKYLVYSYDFLMDVEINYHKVKWDYPNNVNLLYYKRICYAYICKARKVSIEVKPKVSINTKFDETFNSNHQLQKKLVGYNVGFVIKFDTESLVSEVRDFCRRFKRILKENLIESIYCINCTNHRGLYLTGVVKTEHYKAFKIIREHILNYYYEVEWMEVRRVHKKHNFPYIATMPFTYACYRYNKELFDKEISQFHFET